MNKYYLDLSKKDEMNAGTKAVSDCNKILQNAGFAPFYIPLNVKYNFFIKPLKKMKSLLMFKSIPDNSVVVVPHPIYTKKIYIDYLSKVKKKKNVKYIFLIHDIESLRGMFPELKEKFAYIDAKMLEIADFIIAHNEKMKDYLVEREINANKIVILEIFDYLINDSMEKDIHFSKSVTIAGNLDVNKSQYIEKYSRVCKYSLDLYGVNFDDKMLVNDNVKYHGSFPADDIPNILDKGFGLVWDGHSMDECTGNTGNYLKYNNPHKLSLYIASGLPVIIWSKAAEAKFVLDNQLGFAVDSLQDINSLFQSLTKEDYDFFKSNVANIRDKMIHGYYLKKAILKIEKMI